MTTLKVKKFNKNAIIPTKRNEDAGYDLYGLFDEDPKFLYPGDIYLVPLGIGTEFSKEYVFFITERSGAGVKGISTRAGVIDSGYRGEIKTPLNNVTKRLIIFSDKPEEEIKKEYSDKLHSYENNFIIYPQSKAIAQGMILPCFDLEVEEVWEFSESKRGEGGFGSSNK